MQLLSPLLIENAISNEVNLCLTKALTVTDYLQMPSLQVKFWPPVFNFRIGSFAFPQLTGLVWGYTICCCILHIQSPVSTGYQQHQNSFIRSFPPLHKEAYEILQPGNIKTVFHIKKKPNTKKPTFR